MTWRRATARLAAAAGAVVFAASVGACSPNSPTPSASGPAGLGASAPPGPPGLSWVKAASVQRPDEAFATTTTASVAPDATGRAGHPGHFVGQAIVEDVAAAGGTDVAVGEVGVDGRWTAIAWSSADGYSWSLHAIEAAPGSFARRVTALPDGGQPGRPAFVAVGRSGTLAVAWTSPDGSSWERHELPTRDGSPTPAADRAERATAVAVVDGTIVVGGSEGPELGDRHARFWRSTDGRTWTADPDETAFDDAEVTALSAGSAGIVAVGRTGSAQHAEGSVAWLFDRGTWARSADSGLTGGVALGLAAAPNGGLVAVGARLDGRPAMAWRSVDGRSWTVVADQPALDYSGQGIGMTDVIAVPGGLVAVGSFSSLQRPTATSWTSTDGETWQRASAEPDLEQAEMLAVTQAGPQLLAVGSYGLPDDFVPTIWVGQTPGG